MKITGLLMILSLLAPSFAQAVQPEKMQDVMLDSEQAQIQMQILEADQAIEATLATWSAKKLSRFQNMALKRIKRLRARLNQMTDDEINATVAQNLQGTGMDASEITREKLLSAIDESEREVTHHAKKGNGWKVLIILAVCIGVIGAGFIFLAPLMVTWFGAYGVAGIFANYAGATAAFIVGIPIVVPIMRAIFKMRD